MALLLILVSGLASRVDAADSSPDTGFSEAKRSIQTQLRSKQPTDRIQAFYKLREFHDPEAAKLVLQLGLRDASADVRVAAYETLRGYSEDADICNLLFAALRKAAKSKEASNGADVLLSVLLASKLEATDEELAQYLDKQLATAPSGPAIVALTADNLGLHGEATDLPPLIKLAKCKLFAENFAVRRSVVQATMRIREKEAIDQLINLLESLQGESRGDIVQYLTAVTKQEHGLNTAAWKTWWKGTRETFEFPPLAQDVMPLAKAPAGNRASYYGLPLFAQRLVFVFDTSGSMGGPRLAAAQRELVNAITTLPDEAYFGIVVFNSRVDAWQKQLVPATKKNKDAATRFIGGLAAREQTGTYDALAAAFSYDAEAIYLLTDGAPTTGRVVNPAEIVAAVTRGNLPRRLSIYTVGIGVGPEGNPFDQFLRDLAAQNYGQYRRIDN